MNQPPFAFGQTVWVPWANAHAQHREPCPICFGKRLVKVTLGNGEEVQVECEMCGLGFEGPRGFLMEYGVESGVNECTVTGMTEEWDGWHIEVNHGGRHCLEELYLSAGEAEERRQVLQREAERNAKDRRDSIVESKRKNLTWKAGYHRRCIADLKRQIEWHEARLGMISTQKGGTAGAAAAGSKGDTRTNSPLPQAQQRGR